ncbi:hypothetical protein CCL16_15310 [Pseudomonas syringae]|nr:hypothetical protein CCL16_15310 [Pseudomonas syringae]PYD19034.1 hypothetical protein DND47_00075 [Pseudomonas syringae pv. syringae]
MMKISASNKSDLRHDSHPGKVNQGPSSFADELDMNWHKRPEYRLMLFNINTKVESGDATDNVRRLICRAGFHDSTAMTSHMQTHESQ